MKLQDPEHVRSFYRLQERVPACGLGAAKLVMKKAMGETGKMVAMVAAPLLVRVRIPFGKAAQLNLPSISVKHNVVTMDENADVTFGVKEYPPWVRNRS